MNDYMPSICTDFIKRHPDVAGAKGAPANPARHSVPFDTKTMFLLELALALGAGVTGAVRSNAHKGPW